eukprot:TRINITY_DN5273_c0_g2_i2.p1 TRINITY_DN5273_c0_g2~~TRINITY_DN5273_c0_g2_i2.p1  ORF type:complete len:312 (-),score=30.58 TRINITY_DN5273_c0_g2_i2:137-1072(-)
MGITLLSLPGKIFQFSFMMTIMIIFGSILRTNMYLEQRMTKFPAWASIQNIKDLKILTPEPVTVQSYVKSNGGIVLPINLNEDPYELLSRFKSQSQAKILMFDSPFLEYYTANDCDLVILHNLESHRFNVVTFYKIRVSDEFVREVDKAIINTTLFYNQEDEINRFNQQQGSLECSRRQRSSIEMYFLDDFTYLWYMWCSSITLGIAYNGLVCILSRYFVSFKVERVAGVVHVRLFENVLSTANLLTKTSWAKIRNFRILNIQRPKVANRKKKALKTKSIVLERLPNKLKDSRPKQSMLSTYFERIRLIFG